MKKLLMLVLPAMILFMTGCANAKDDSSISSIEATVSSINEERVVVESHDTTIELNLDEVMILKDDFIIEPDDICQDDEVLCTYSKGSLKVMQVIRSKHGDKKEDVSNGQ